MTSKLNAICPDWFQVYYWLSVENSCIVRGVFYCFLFMKVKFPKCLDFIVENLTPQVDNCLFAVKTMSWFTFVLEYLRPGYVWSRWSCSFLEAVFRFRCEDVITMSSVNVAVLIHPVSGEYSKYLVDYASLWDARVNG